MKTLALVFGAILGITALVAFFILGKHLGGDEQPALSKSLVIGESTVAIDGVSYDSLEAAIGSLGSEDRVTVMPAGNLSDPESNAAINDRVDHAAELLGERGIEGGRITVRLVK